VSTAGLAGGRCIHAATSNGDIHSLGASDSGQG
jgi:hypothetical protein